MERKVDAYLRKQAARIRPEDRFRYHLMPRSGWMNDPNGFSFHDGRIHLFYQHFPYATVWGPMHWGHASSVDFVAWEQHPLALTPGSGKGILGAFSGSAIDFGGTYNLLYTRAAFWRQEQCLATSTDGITFVKYDGNPVIPSTMLPPDAVKHDFRDPKVWERDGHVNLLVANRNAADAFAKLLVYRSDDLRRWTYVGVALRNGPEFRDVLGEMLECPDYAVVDGSELLIVSPQDIPGHPNRHGAVYLPGRFDEATGTFTGWTKEDVRTLDHGLDFYAPQTMRMPDGRVVLVAWMQSWNRRPLYADVGFAGAMTFPRELRYVDGTLRQTPVRELAAHHGRGWIGDVPLVPGTPIRLEGVHGMAADLELAFIPGPGRTGITVFADAGGDGLDIYYEAGRVVLDRRRILDGRLPATPTDHVVSMPCPLLNGTVRLRILLDRWSCEVFTADGTAVMTATCRPREGQDGVLGFADGVTALALSFHEIIATVE